MSHSPEPWKLIDEPRNCHYRDALLGSYERETQYCWYIADARGNSNFVADLITGISERDKENAERIVACVNACAGIPTDLLVNKYARLLVSIVNQGDIYPSYQTEKCQKYPPGDVIK